MAKQKSPDFKNAEKIILIIEEGCFKQTDANLVALNILVLVRAAFIDRLMSIHLPETTENDLTKMIMGYILSLLGVNDHHTVKNKS